MNIKSIDDHSLIKGAEYLKPYWKIPDEYEIYAKKGDSLNIRFEDRKIYITYPLKASFFRALSLASLSISKNEMKEMNETIYFDECGVMLDLSRNGVMTIKSLKKYVDYMALTGLNQLYLYLEDTYEIEGNPYFGYMRGRYTKEELKEIDEYCDSIGIEVIPHIQTLGHMEQYLKWDEARKYRDTVKILLADDEPTYDFIKKAIVSISSCFKTKKIHLGMDEAGDLGSGNYYRIHGPAERKAILINHIKKVTAIAEELDLIPIIYGDVIYELALGRRDDEEIISKSGSELSDFFKTKIPQNVIPVYWNYYSDDYQLYKNRLQSYKSLTGKTIFWGGIWTWMGMTYDSVMTIKLTEPAMRACKDTGVRSVIGSIWEDDGCETNAFLSVHGLMYYAESMYNDKVDENLFKERFEYIFKTDYDAFIEMSYFHNDYDNYNGYKTYHDRYIGKRYFWSDILLCMLDEDLSKKPMADYYKELASKYERFLGKYTNWNEEFEFIHRVINTTAKKCFMSENLRKAYLNSDKEFLAKCVNELLPELKECYLTCCEIHRREWYKVYKPFGFEVLDVRYGGIINRINTAILRITQYLDGDIDAIEELESERLLHRCEGFQRRFAGIITASNKI